MKISVLIVGIFLTACAATPRAQWVPIDKTVPNEAALRFKGDYYQCERDKLTANFKGRGFQDNRPLSARETAGALFFGEQAVQESREYEMAENFFLRCMELRGWKIETR